MSEPQQHHAAIATRLRARRAELETVVTQDDGPASEAGASQDQAIAIEIERRREVELARIDSALQRLAEGAYGYCVTCDEEIEPQRLELDPAIPLCLTCARRAD